MNNDTLKLVIAQIKKYNLAKNFENVDEFKEWVSNLTNLQINNFLSLNINLDEINKVKHLLINSNLLKCNDYVKKVEAISKLKNGDGCWHLFENLCTPNFLQSDRFYQDIELLSKADTARYALWIIGEDSFINSPYHTEDLKLIVEANDVKKDNPLDFIVSDALATVAGNIDSIKSPYHQNDMSLISKSGSDCLQLSYSYPESGLNKLAINKVSLNDKYHLENMKILATNPVSKKFLYIIMTDSNIIKGKHYRKEVEALLNAKSVDTARAIFYYITNPNEKQKREIDFFNNNRIGYIGNAYIDNENSVIGNMTPNYLRNLDTINEISDRFIMHYVSLLMNSKLFNNEFMDYDLKLLRNICDVSAFMDLYRFITNEASLKNPFHKSDIELLSKTKNSKIRELLLEKTTDEYSFKNQNRSFDLKYISSLNIDNIDNKIFKQMYYFLFSKTGIDTNDHQEVLKMLYQGVYVEAPNQVATYLSTLELNLNELKSEDNFTKTNSDNNKNKVKILNLFKKNEKK